jgi:D-glycero-D-manno-heptose 1,7-bisphosphate phosphatase
MAHAACFVDPAAHRLLEGWPRPRAALFLDRDGIVNTDRGYVHTEAGTEWIPGIFELVAGAWDAGRLPIVITNQAGIARGYYDEAQFLDYTRWVHGAFAARGAPLLATFFCPHHPVHGTGPYLRECDCRKPAPGMLLAACGMFDIAPERSTLLGDKASDVEAGVAAGLMETRLVAPGEALPRVSGLFGERRP